MKPSKFIFVNSKDNLKIYFFFVFYSLIPIYFFKASLTIFSALWKLSSIYLVKENFCLGIEIDKGLFILFVIGSEYGFISTLRFAIALKIFLE